MAEAGEAASEVTAADETVADSKPEFVDEKFWNQKDQSVDVEGLSKSYAELGGKVREKSGKVREGILAEMEATKNDTRPATANDYEVKVPDAIAATFEDGMGFEFKDDDPMMTWWKETAHSQGFSQEQFEEGLSAYVTSQFANMSNPDDELAILGENGRDRVNHVQLWAQRGLSEQSYEAVEGFASTAAGVTALEELMRNSGEPAFSPGGPAGQGSNISLEDLRTMQADERYWHPAKRDPEFIKKVDEGYVKLVAAG